jgi:hypothetical protein
VRFIFCCFLRDMSDCSFCSWVSWERHRCTTNCAQFPNACINEGLYKRVTDRLVSGDVPDFPHSVCGALHLPNPDGYVAAG